MRKAFVLSTIGIVVASTLVAGLSAGKATARSNKDDGWAGFEFFPGTLVLSRSVYEGKSSSVVVGETLPPGCVAGNVSVPLLAGGSASVAVSCATATNDGSYPNVFFNAASDPSFGVSSPIFLDSITTDGERLGTLPIPSDQVVTSFSSKSELAVNRSTDGKSITFGGYRGGTGFVTGPNQIDVSNSNTPGVVDSTNPVVSQYYRAVAEIDSHGHLTITDSNAYSGDNGRAVIKGNWTYYTAGNSNNGGLSKAQLTTTQTGVNLVQATGAQLLVPGQTAPVPPNLNKIGDFEITQVGYTKADKPGKDNNFRGITIFDNTLYVTKGSGSNGINTVYQVGNAGTLPSGTTAELASLPITILPGFPTSLASGVDQSGNAAPVAFPFGLYFANANTLYVCDEGDGTLVTPAVNGNVATTAAQTTGGVQKWILSEGTWHLAYVLNNGLNIGEPYSVRNYPSALSPATDGCRNITGRVRHDGKVEIYAVTSTVSASGDQGADPNKLVKVIDVLDATTLPASISKGRNEGERIGQFTALRSAQYGEVLRGISFAPQDRDDEGNGR